MSYTNQQPKDFMKSMQIIHTALIAGPFLFGLYIIISAPESLFFSYTNDKPLLYMALLVAFGGNIASKMLFAKQLKQIPFDAEISVKISRYMSAYLIRTSLLELPALMCLVFVYLSDNSFYFILAAILLFMMLVIFPSKQRLVTDLSLTEKEKSIIEKL